MKNILLMVAVAMLAAVSAQAQKIHIVRLAGFCVDGVAEHQQKIDLVALHPRGDLLIAALRAAEEAVDRQACRL